MAINKATLARMVDNTIEYVYPKSSADLIDYDATQTVAQKIASIDTSITTMDARITNIASSTVSGDVATDATEELVDIRLGADGTTYASAGEAVRQQLTQLSNDWSRQENIDYKILNITNYFYITENFQIGGYSTQNRSNKDQTRIRLKNPIKLCAGLNLKFDHIDLNSYDIIYWLISSKNIDDMNATVISSGWMNTNSTGLNYTVKDTYDNWYLMVSIRHHSSTNEYTNISISEFEDQDIAFSISSLNNNITNRIDILQNSQISVPSLLTKNDFSQGYVTSSGTYRGDVTNYITNINKPLKVNKNDKILFNIDENKFNYYLLFFKDKPINSNNVIFASYSTMSLVKNGKYHICNYDGYAIINLKLAASGNLTPNDLEEGWITIDNKDNINSFIITDNIIDYTYFTNGVFSSTTGFSNSGSGTRIRLLDSVYMKSNTIIKPHMDLTSMKYYVWELSTNASNGPDEYNVLAYSGWNSNESYTVLNDSYVMIAVAFTNDAIIFPSDFKNNYIDVLKPDIQHECYNTLYCLNEASGDENKVINFSNAVASSSGNIDTFLFYTDIHIPGENNWKDKMYISLQYMKLVYNTAPVDFCIFGGDVITSDTSYSNNMLKSNNIYYLSWFDKINREYFGYDRYLCVAGNHDYNYLGAEMMTEQEITNCMFRQYGNSYYSYEANNCMIYVLNTGINQTLQTPTSYDVTMDLFKWQQIYWLANKLKEDNPDHAIIAMHIIINNNVLTDYCLYQEANDIANAFNNKQTITKNLIQYDFTNCTGKVELFLGGNLHSDTYHGYRNNIPYVTRANTVITGYDATFDIVLCDWDNRNITFKRFGYGDDLQVSLS